MKNYSYIGISLIILIFGIIFIPKIVDRVKEGRIVAEDRLSQKDAEENINSEDLAFIEINGKRKKAPEFELINQDGDTVSSEDYLGKVYVAEFFFTTCPTICPIMSANLVKVQGEFENDQDFGIASFSVDPKHDTPEVLTEYAETYGITHPNWHLLTGDREEIYGLANGGYNIYADEDEYAAGGFAHQGLFALVDKEGYIRSRTDQFGNPIVYYRGSVEQDAYVPEGGEEPQIDILIEDIKKLK